MHYIWKGWRLALHECLPSFMLALTEVYLGTLRWPERVQVRPPANPQVLAQVDSCDAIVYGIGSLFTSICPTLVLQVGCLPMASASACNLAYWQCMLCLLSAASTGRWPELVTVVCVLSQPSFCHSKLMRCRCYPCQA